MPPTSVASRTPAICGHASIWTRSETKSKIYKSTTYNVVTNYRPGPGDVRTCWRNSHRRGGESASICQKWGLILTLVQLASKLDLPQLVHFKQKRTWARVSWICAVVLLLMTSAQSAHMCGLAGDLRLHHGKAAQADNIDSPHTFCAICASSHSPSFAVSLTSLPSIDSLTERSLQRSIVRRSSSPVFALYTRPPPAV